MQQLKWKCIVSAQDIDASYSMVHIELVQYVPLLDSLVFRPSNFSICCLQYSVMSCRTVLLAGPVMICFRRHCCPTTRPVSFPGCSHLQFLQYAKTEHSILAYCKHLKTGGGDGEATTPLSMAVPMQEKSSLVPRPRPAFHRLQYGKTYCMWWKAGRGLGTRLGEVSTARKKCSG